MTQPTPRPPTTRPARPLTTREAMPEESEEVIGMCVAAFADEAVTTWILPDPSVRDRAMQEMFRSSLGATIEAGHLILVIDPDGAPVAASTWLPRTGDEATGDPLSAPADDDPVSVRLRTLQEATASRQPGVGHLHLASMAVLPAYRRQGAGGLLVMAGLARAERRGLPVHLEASTPGSRALDQRHGFRDRGQPIHLPDSGPTLQPMWRGT